jgi:D-sedoheptulose 7-phosphate isomerase
MGFPRPLLILLDRDGVLNSVVVDADHGTVGSPLHPDQVTVLPWVPGALADLAAGGATLCVVSNQPGAAKGQTTRRALDEVNQRVLDVAQGRGARVASSHLCFHRAEDGCACRKPRTGLLEEAWERHGRPPRDACWMVGDGVTDVQAGAALGFHTAFLAPRKCDACAVLERAGVTPTFWGRDLRDLVTFFSGNTGETMAETTFSSTFLDETAAVLRALDREAIERLAVRLGKLRDDGGRLFILGVGGSAGHAGHAVNDFRKICGLEAYAPTDNVSELTARVNDEGWETTFVEWLRGSRVSSRDGVLVFSVGGGNRERNVSVNLVRALDLCRTVGAAVLGIVGKDGGYTAQVAEACVVIPPLYPDHVTPHTEGLCAVVWHLLVSHPALKKSVTKWESVQEAAR